MFKEASSFKIVHIFPSSPKAWPKTMDKKWSDLRSWRLGAKTQRCKQLKNEVLKRRRGLVFGFLFFYPWTTKIVMESKDDMPVFSHVQA